MDIIKENKKKRKDKELLQIDQKAKINKVVKPIYKEIAKEKELISMVQGRPILLEVLFTMNIYTTIRKRNRIDLSNIIENTLSLLLSLNVQYYTTNNIIRLSLLNTKRLNPFIIDNNKGDIEDSTNEKNKNIIVYN